MAKNNKRMEQKHWSTRIILLTIVAHYMPPTNYCLLTAQQKPYKKSQLSLDEKCENCVGGGKKGCVCVGGGGGGDELFVEKWQNGKSQGQGRKTREQNQWKGESKDSPQISRHKKNTGHPQPPFRVVKVKPSRHCDSSSTGSGGSLVRRQWCGEKNVDILWRLPTAW